MADTLVQQTWQSKIEAVPGHSAAHKDEPWSGSARTSQPPEQPASADQTPLGREGGEVILHM